MEQAKTVSGAFISVGTPEYKYETSDAHLGLPHLWSVFSAMNQTDQQHCVGDLLLNLVDEHGNPCGSDANQSANTALVYSIGLETLRQIAKSGSVWVLAARARKGKARVIKGALEAELINSIVVDATIAHELLEL